MRTILLIPACFSLVLARPQGSQDGQKKNLTRPSPHDQAVDGFHDFIQTMLDQGPHNYTFDNKNLIQVTDEFHEFVQSLNNLTKMATDTQDENCMAHACFLADGEPTIPGQAMCGKKKYVRNADQHASLNMDARIVGGEMAMSGEIPWIGSLRIRHYKYPFCGLSVYNEFYVITAAHCVTDELTDDPSELDVVLSEYDTGKSEGNERVYLVQDIIVHEQYDSTNVKNDIALLKLATKIDLSHPGISPVCLPSAQMCDNLSGKQCLIAGWGKTSYRGTVSQVLLKATTTIENDENCAEDYAQEFQKTLEICARQKGIDTCQGDSGGPITCEENGNHQLVGIASWGYGCASPEYPGVYTRVCNFVSWIKSKAD